MAKLSDVDITSLLFQEGSAPSTPASTKWRLYAKTDGLYYKDDAGVETGPLASASGALGAWTTYTPTWASGGTTSIGNGTLTGRYKLLDANTGLLHVRFAWGSTTSDSGSGTWVFGLPSGWTAASGTYQILAGHIADAGTDHKLCVGKISPSGTTIAEVVPEASNTVTKATPMTWATNDQLNLSGIVELA